MSDPQANKLFHVLTNKYAHTWSGVTRVDSEHTTEPEAIQAANTLWETGQRRFVHVEKWDGERWVEIYKPIKKETSTFDPRKVVAFK